MASTTAEEVEALEAIYCGHEEFTLHQLGDGRATATILTVRVRSDEPRCHFVDVTFVLKNDYPMCVPHISLSCPSISRTDTASLKAEVERYAETLIGQPMLLMLTLCVKGHLENFAVDRTEVQATDDGRCTHRILLLHVDHMRAKVRYTKTVRQWTDELALTGRLICHERLIVIVLEGTKDALKEYLVRHRTVAIDVDSKGRDCKERMMSVLMDVAVDNTVQRQREQHAFELSFRRQIPIHVFYDGATKCFVQMFTDFKVTQLVKATEVEEVFVKSGLTLEYEAHVVPLMKRQ